MCVGQHARTSTLVHINGSRKEGLTKGTDFISNPEQVHGFFSFNWEGGVVSVGKGQGVGGIEYSLFMAQLGWSKKKLEASFNPNELKDMPGRVFNMHTGLFFLSYK